MFLVNPGILVATSPVWKSQFCGKISSSQRTKGPGRDVLVASLLSCSCMVAPEFGARVGFGCTGVGENLKIGGGLMLTPKNIPGLSE